MIKMIRDNGGILGIFALVTTSMIALTYHFTFEHIEAAKERQLLDVLNQVVTTELYDNDLHFDCIEVPANPLLGNKVQRVFRARKNNENVAIILETTSTQGYSGDIDLIVAIDTSQRVLSARVTAHKETPGLGDKIDIRVSDWILSVNQQHYSPDTRSRWRVKKDGGEFDQFTGATITPRATINAIADAAQYGQAHLDSLFSLDSNCPKAIQDKRNSNNIEANQNG